jgi:hypothetical protein
VPAGTDEVDSDGGAETVGSSPTAGSSLPPHDAAINTSAETNTTLIAVRRHNTGVGSPSDTRMVLADPEGSESSA